MQIILEKIRIENFKGLKLFETDFSPHRTLIISENGVGKTTIYDAFLWCLFGKDSTGRAEFEIHPIGPDKLSVRGIVTAVEIIISINNCTRLLRKELREKVVKKRNQLLGYDTYCFIDQVPKKVHEYNAFISDIIKEDIFKLFTDLQFFSVKMEWKERRDILLSLAGDIDRPGGFKELFDNLKGRSVDEYKLYLQGQKKLLIKERDEINPRIDEINRALESYIVEDNVKLEQTRVKIQNRIAELSGQRKDLLSKEQERQELQDKINGLERKKIQREGELKSDTTAIQDLLDERISIKKTTAAMSAAADTIRDNIADKDRILTDKKDKLDNYTENLEEIRQDRNKAETNPIEDICYACGQKFPVKKIAIIKKELKEHIESLKDQAADIKDKIKTCDSEIEKLENEIQDLQNKLADSITKIQDYEIKAAKRLGEIDQAIRDNKTPPPEQDQIWQGYCREIKRLQDQIGDPVTEQLNNIETFYSTANNELTKVNNALAQSDRNKKDKERIAELTDREKDLSEQINDADRRLADIRNYEIALSNLIESAVNNKFKYVRFKLFEQLLNEGIRPCCVAIYNGVPYADLSAGQQILAGIDIINVLSSQHETKVPLFIDHCESLTTPIAADLQIIELHAQSGVPALIVEKKDKPKQLAGDKLNDNKTAKKSKSRKRKR